MSTTPSTPLDLVDSAQLEQASSSSREGTRFTHAPRSSIGSVQSPPERDSKRLSPLQSLSDWSNMTETEILRPVSPLPEEVAEAIHFTDEELLALKQLAQDAADHKVLTRTSTLSSMIHQHREDREAQALIHDQMDRIYGDPALTQYFHAFNIAMVALLDGSLLFQEVDGRVGVQIETDTKYELISGTAGLIGGAIPGLEQVASVIEKVCGALNKKDFGEANAKLSGLMEPDQIQAFVPSMARPLTLAMADRLAKSSAGGSPRGGASLKEFAKSTYQQLTHLQKKVSGTAGASSSETAIIVMGFRHASKIAFAMADGANQNPPLLLPDHASLSEKIDLTLKWYCEHSNRKGNPTMTYDSRDLVIGVACDYKFKTVARTSDKHTESIGGASARTDESQAVRELKEEVRALRSELAEVKQHNLALEDRVAALESGLPAADRPFVGTSQGAATAGEVAEMRETMSRLQAAFELDRLCRAPRTLTQAADIIGTFLAELPKDNLHQKVVETSDGLVRKDALLGSRTVKQYLEQKYGSTRGGTTCFTVEDDLRDCARKWVKRWSGELDDRLLDVARSA